MKGVRVPINWKTRLFERTTRRITSVSVIGYRVRVCVDYHQEGVHQQPPTSVANHQIPNSEASIFILRSLLDFRDQIKTWLASLVS